MSSSTDDTKPPPPPSAGKDPFDGLFGDLPAESQKNKAVKEEEEEEEGPAAAAAAAASAEAEEQEEGEAKKRKAEAGASGGGGGGQKKRPREEEGAGGGFGGSGSKEKEKEKEKGGTVELEVALQKISAALRSSKVEKFRKVRVCAFACLSGLEDGLIGYTCMGAKHIAIPRLTLFPPTVHRRPSCCSSSWLTWTRATAATSTRCVRPAGRPSICCSPKQSAR
jgi:hypothetical protein